MSTEQRVRLRTPAVPETKAGALELDRAYWAEVELVLRGLVRIRRNRAAVDIRLRGGGPALIRLRGPELAASGGRVACRYSIEGGLLARIPAGELTLEQAAGEAVELRSSVRGFHPRLAARPGFPRWTGLLYARGQARLHEAIGRRFLARLAGKDCA